MATDLQKYQLERILEQLLPELTFTEEISENDVKAELNILWEQSGMSDTEGRTIDTFEKRLRWVVEHVENWLIHEKNIPEKVANECCVPLRIYMGENLRETLERIKGEATFIPFKGRKK